MSVDLRFVDEAVERIGRTPDAVIPILQAMQDHYGYLPEEALRRVCELSLITPAQLVGVSTFYSQFRHRGRGNPVLFHPLFLPARFFPGFAGGNSPPPRPPRLL